MNNIRYRELNYYLLERQLTSIKCYLAGVTNKEIKITIRTEIVVLPLTARHCGKGHKMHLATLYLQGKGIPCQYCQKCNRICINQNHLLRWSWSPIFKNIFNGFDFNQREIHEKLTRNSDEEWFTIYRKYCDDQFVSVRAYAKYLDREHAKKIEEEKARIKAFENEMTERQRIVREEKIRRGEPLGTLPKQRRRGFFS